MFVEKLLLLFQLFVFCLQIFSFNLLSFTLLLHFSVLKTQLPAETSPSLVDFKLLHFSEIFESFISSIPGVISETDNVGKKTERAEPLFNRLKKHCEAPSYAHHVILECSEHQNTNKQTNK